ncbi:HesA/MoeB/ThiF family protein [Bacillus sp. NPDC093026]|uniref:HesA/MoeB/ThiF family protein n=1 Tax=Bacillus sp. NPDC093026 TaxID=3363948 RepID=UPI00381FC2BB
MKLKDGVLVRYVEDCCVLNKGTMEYTIIDPDKYYYKIMSKGFFDKDTPDEIMNFLKENGLVCNEYNQDDVDGYLERNLYYFEAISEDSNINPIRTQQDLSQKKIVIIGGGGIGTVVIDNLQRIGIKKFYLIDFDVVEHSNLNRQILFNENDVGKNKVHAISEKVINSVIVDGENIKIQERKDLEIQELYDADFVVNCADTPSNINEIVGSFCFDNRIPFISGRVGIETGEWGPVYDKSNPFSHQNIYGFKGKIKGSISPTNSIIGCFIANEVMLYLTNLIKDYSFYKRKTINFKNLSITVGD